MHPRVSLSLCAARDMVAAILVIIGLLVLYKGIHGQTFEVLGVLSMVVGFLFAFGLAGLTWKRTGQGARASKSLRDSLGGAILLGLELLVAVDIVKTVTSTPSLTDAAVLGMIVLIRTVLSISIEIEVDGVAPWRKPMTTGPQVLARRHRWLHPDCCEHRPDGRTSTACGQDRPPPPPAARTPRAGQWLLRRNGQGRSRTG